MGSGRAVRDLFLLLIMASGQARARVVSVVLSRVVSALARSNGGLERCRTTDRENRYSVDVGRGW